MATTGLVALGAMAPASAQDPAQLSSYGAGAQATALQLSITDQSLAFSVTGAAVAGQPAEAAANGAAFLLAGDELTTAATPGGPATAEDCALDEELPAPINLAGLELACVQMATDAAPSGSSESAEIVLEVIDAEAVVTIVDTALRPALLELLAGLEPLLTALDPVLDAPTLDEVVTTLLDQLSSGDTLARITVAPTSSDASAVQGAGASNGVVVELVPTLDFITAIVGSSTAEATADPATGEVVTTGDAAYIDVDLAGLEALLGTLVNNLGGALGEPIAGAIGPALTALVDAVETQIPDAFNQTVDQLACGEDNPLTPLLCFTAGGVNELDAEAAAALGYDFGPTTRGIQAEVLDLAVLSAAGPAPLLGLRVGGASAAAAAVPAQPLPNDPAPEVPRGDAPLPRTGGEAALPLALGLLAVAAVGGTLLRRTRSA